MKRSTWIAVSALALAAACGPQAQNEATAPPEITAPAPTPPISTAVAPADFVQQVANSDAFEIQAAEIAAQRGMRADVKEFARMMRTDHGATTRELSGIVTQVNLAAPTVALSSDQTSKLEALRNASGEAFDDLYLDQQVAAHQDAVSLFQRYLDAAPSDPLRQWAEATLPKLRTHLERVQSLENAT